MFVFFFFAPRRSVGRSLGGRPPSPLARSLACSRSLSLSQENLWIRGRVPVFSLILTTTRGRASSDPGARDRRCDGAGPPPLAIDLARSPPDDEAPTTTVATTADRARRDAGDPVLVSRERGRRGGPVRAQALLGLQHRHVFPARAGLHGPPPDVVVVVAARSKVRGGQDLEPERS